MFKLIGFLFFHPLTKNIRIYTFLAKEDIFIDVGSNSGVYTVLASKVIDSKTVTFEPINSSFDRLKGNIKLNGIVLVH